MAARIAKHIDDEEIKQELNKASEGLKNAGKNLRLGYPEEED